MKLPISVLAFVFASLLFSDFASAVHRGRPATAQDSAQTVFIEFQRSAVQCSAVIVDRHLLLTAGHCLHGIRSQNVVMKVIGGSLGAVNYLTTMQWKRAPGYQQFDEDEQIPVSAIRNEIAYIVTKEDLLETFNLGEAALPLLPAASDHPTMLLKAQTANAVTYGYGQMGIGNSHKLAARLNAQLNEDAGFFRVFSLDKDARVCRGDSGAGLLLSLKGAPRRVLAGIAAGITWTCDVVQSEAFYAPLSPHLCWIQRESRLSLGHLMLDGGVSCR